MVKNRGIWVYDIETLASCFTYSAINVDTEEVVQFVLHKERNDLEDFLNHLKSCRAQIGFNNTNFDYPIIHMIMEYGLCPNHITTGWDDFTIEDKIKLIYNKAQRIIEEQNKKDFTTIVAIPLKEVLIPQVDLFKIWHYNNKARATSLKALEISMNYPNVMEMPISHTKEDITLEEIESILEYNLNDVLATYEFYKKTIEFGKLDLRKKISKKFKLPCTNWNNGKIGEQLILKLYCDLTEQDPWEVKKWRTYRETIALKDCVPDNITFKTKDFNKLLEFYKKSIVRETKGSLDYSLIYKNLKYEYGLGGLHACIKPGIYDSDEKYIIKTCDVASLYPNIPIVYNFWIEHLGEEFLTVYRDEIVNVRLAEKVKPKEQQDKAIIDGYKEAANIPYGKSNDVNSFLYDPLYTLKTTIIGQLTMSKLCEELSTIPDSQILMVNTDGLEIKIPRSYEWLYDLMCKEWQDLTKLTLEFNSYKRMWIADINNYGCLDSKDKIKNKGRFEVDKIIGSEPAYHKDNSFRVVPLALQEYFTKGIPVEDTIHNHKNIYDFCGRQKFKSDSYGQTHTLVGDKEVTVKQQKNVRYYISNKGSTFIKYYNKGTSAFINKGHLVTIFNKFKEKEDYDLNRLFYIKECYKEIELIEKRQLELF